LPSPEAKAEEPLGEDGEEDQAAGEHRLTIDNGANEVLGREATQVRSATSHPTADLLGRSCCCRGLM
jgi:hypothetical protein